MIYHRIDSIADAKKASDTAAALERVATITFVKLAEAGQMDDRTATENCVLFMDWGFPANYAAGQIRTCEGMIYRCLQDHTAYSEAEQPGLAPALWKQIGDPTDEWPEYSQPICASDAYQIGDRISFEGGHYVCVLANCIWSPDNYPHAWELVEKKTADPEEDPEDPDPADPEPEVPEIPEFIQPTGAHDTYNSGDKVSYDGKIYECQVDGCVYSPADYPGAWKEAEA